MIRIRGSLVLVSLFALVFLISLTSQVKGSEYRVRGSLGFQAYGYEDIEYSGQQNQQVNTDEVDHLWIFQSTRFSIYKTSSSLSIHFSGGYIGDNQDDFSHSGQGRLLKGYIQYGGIGSKHQARLGRFFLYKGVAIGTLDGAEMESAVGKNYKVSLFAGLLGPLNRGFEFEDASGAFSAGGELKWLPGDLWEFRNTSLALSYARLTRNEEEIRHRIGLNAYGRYDKHTSLMAIMQFRPSGNVFRKMLLRLNHFTPELKGMLEAGVFTPDVAEYSWFSSFEFPAMMRVRFALDKFIVLQKWAVGLDGAVIMNEDGTGTRLGPVVTTPYGQLGYRLYAGDQANSTGPWISLRYTPLTGLETYAYGAYTSYEWDAFDIEAEELISFSGGLRFTPERLDDFTLSAEYQVYRTPEVTSDRRMMGGIEWRFDTGRTGK